MKLLKPSLVLAFAGALIGTAPDAAAFPATKESAQVTLTFNLAPTVDGSGTSSGTVVTEVTRTNGVATSTPLEVTLTGLADGTYTVAATLKSDAGAAPVAIGSIVVDATPDPNAPPAEDLNLPAGLDPFNIATITISDSRPAVILSGPATLDVTEWKFKANVALSSPPVVPGAPKTKKIHGHVVIHATILDNVEKKRKFLLVAQGFAPNATITVKLDGVAVGSVVATKKGKLMLKSLDGDFRLAGVQLLTLTDEAGAILAEADFFPSVE